MEITYKKICNTQLFKKFMDNNLLNMTSCQNYIPLYNKFFMLNNNNFNLISLNNKNILASITEKITENIFTGVIKDENDCSITKNVFFKLSPLLDPFKYMAGKYDISDQNLFDLPKLNDNKCHSKVIDGNNAAYVDSFFTYLTSQLLNRSAFLHGLDFYGSYLGIKNNFYVDIGDDIEMLSENPFFHNNTNVLFSFVNNEHADLFNEDSRNNKRRLEFGEDISDTHILNLEDHVPLNKLNKSSPIGVGKDICNNSVLIYDDNVNLKSSSSSSSSSGTSEISSRSSNTADGKHFKDTSENEYEDSDESSECENIMISLNNFPIQIIALENCDNTFDKLLVEDKLSQDELSCIIVQILMMLITYQKLFKLTHNDLHTNNIMYIQTDRRFLYYKINNKHYKVRTFGKIFKIIDFGRAIYYYKNNLICSDSFHKDGDAATQYNFGPYFNDKKSIIEPNFSFDLCRLGCSIYDFIIEKYDNLKDIKSPIHKIIMNWCVDDDKRNILYKNNDDERYPDFKLYKMIARKVHNHMPLDELNNKHFDAFIVSKKEIKKGSKIMNIDTLCSDTLSYNIQDLNISNSILMDACD